MLGVPGAALISAPLQLPEGSLRVFLSPAQRFALLEDANGSGLGVSEIAAAVFSEKRAVPDSLSRADLVEFSPSGQFALAYSAGAATLQLLKLDGEPAVSGTWAVSDGNIKALAIDDAGQTVVLVCGEDAWLLGQDGVRVLLYRGGEISDLSFLPGAKSLVLADSGTRTLTVIDDVSGVSSTRTFSAAAPEGSLKIEPSYDGRYLLAVVLGLSQAARVDLGTGEFQWLDLPTPANANERLRNADSFLLSTEPEGPAWMVVSDGEQKKAVFAARITPEQQAGILSIRTGR